MRVRGAVVTAAVVAAGFGATAAPALASCVQPEFSITPTSAAPGQQVTAHGKAWFAICTDVNPTGPPPPDGANVFFVQNGRSQQVTYVKAKADLTFDAPFVVPSWAQTGPAVVRGVGRSAQGEARLTITRRELAHTGHGATLPVSAIGLLAAAALTVRIRSTA